MKIINIKSPEDITRTFDTFLELRPSLLNIETFVKQVIDQQKEGYEILAIQENDEIIACMGFRIITMLAWGKILYIDDLITSAKHRQKGCGKKLLNSATEIAKKRGCSQIHLDSGYHRHEAHKTYLKQGFELACHHFGLIVR
jgi:GNAT superfamily N-acetyltransferase